MDQVLDLMAKELKLPRAGVAAIVALLEEGNTVPFIARYRKEATGSLDEVAIRAVEDRHAYYKDLLDRRKTVLKSIDEQGKLTPELKAKIEGTWVKAELEDLYLPYKPKKRTKATVARERGLEPLLDSLLADDSGADPFLIAEPFIKDEDGLRSPSECMEGAGHILAERLTEDAEIRAWLRLEFHEHGVLKSEIREERKADQAALRFKPYFDFSEAIRKIPSHRLLALRRGEKEEILTVKLLVERENLVSQLVSKVQVNPGSGYRRFLNEVAGDAFDRLLAPTIESEVRVRGQEEGRRRGHQGLPDQPRPPAAGAPRGPALHPGRGSRHPHGLQAGGHQPPGPAGAERGDLSPGAQARPGWQPRHPREALRRKSHRGHRHRQRHRWPRGGGLHPRMAARRPAAQASSA